MYDSIKVYVRCFSGEDGFLLFASSLDVNKSFIAGSFKRSMFHPWAVGGPTVL